MSGGWLFNQNFAFKEVLNILCYGSRYPEQLTNFQKFSRLYRSILKMSFLEKFANVQMHSSMPSFFCDARSIKADFHSMLDVTDINKHTEFQDKYEFKMQTYFDPFLVIHPSKPGSALYNPVIDYKNSELQIDPFGYYSCDKTFVDYEDSEYGLVEEYPMTTSFWDYEKRPYYSIKSQVGKEETDMKERLDEAHKST